MSEISLENAAVIGSVGPRSDGVDTEWWEALAENRLLVQRCGGCSRWIWPAQWACPTCHRMDPGWEEVEAKGTLYTWTRTWQPFAAEFKDSLPYISVVVELEGADHTRLVGLLLGDQERDPRIGEPLEGIVQPPSELTGGVPVLRWQRPDIG